MHEKFMKPKHLAKLALLASAACVAATTAMAAPFGGRNGGVNFDGAVYVMSNKIDDNTIVAYGRKSDGGLKFIGEFHTGGDGSTEFDGGEGLDPLISEGSVVLSDDRRLLFAVNAGSNTVSSFRIRRDLSLRLVDVAYVQGVGPNSIAYRDGVIVVSSIDADGVFTGEPDQEGAIESFVVGHGGRLRSLRNSRRVLENRPSSLEFSPDGRFLAVTSINAGSNQLRSGSDDEIVIFGVDRVGRPTARKLDGATSTEVNNPEGRNLPSAIGMDIVNADGRQIVVVTEAREFSAAGAPPAFPALQAGSVSTWEISDFGRLTPISLDVIAGASAAEGERTVCWIVFSDDGEEFWTSNPLESSISSYSFSTRPEDGIVGSISLINATAAQGNEVTSPDPSVAFGEQSDGFLDMDTSDNGDYLYVLAGLRGEVHVYKTEDDGSVDLIQVVDGDLPEIDTQGIAAF